MYRNTSKYQRIIRHSLRLRGWLRRWLRRWLRPWLRPWPARSPARRLLPLLASLALLVGCAGLSLWVQRFDAGPAGIRFSHQFHILAHGLSCQDCHTLAPDKSRYSQPDHSVCLACHAVKDEKKPDESCRLCHAQMPGPVTSDHARRDLQTPSRYVLERYRIGPIHFSHGRHAKESCESCHAGVTKSARAVESHLPEMAQCMSCHNGEKAPATCEGCHPQLPLTWLTKRQGDNWPFPHPPQWAQVHGMSARAQQETCQLCHTPQSCESCHQTQAPSDHMSTGWANGMHGRKALMDRERCAACHTQPTCERCHSVAPASHSTGFMNPYDLNASPEGVQRHRTMAQRDTRACLTCHSFTPDCSTCHSSSRP